MPNLRSGGNLPGGLCAGCIRLSHHRFADAWHQRTGAAKKLKALGSSMPVIILTSSESSLDRSRALNEGAFAYLTKPVNDEVLIRHLMAALGRDE